MQKEFGLSDSGQLADFKLNDRENEITVDDYGGTQLPPTK
jgi:hypothetical protein